MTTPLAFERLLEWVDERSTALRAAAAGHDTAVRVPSCPDWSLLELVEHLTEVQFFWATTVAVGPSGRPPAEPLTGTASGLLERAAEATATLLSVLRAAGPDRGCWTWWGASDVPLTAGAVARHQVHEAAVHAYDAQDAVGRPESLPRVLALDGVGEFADVALGTSGTWPSRRARLGLYAEEGVSWQFDLDDRGASSAPASDRAVDAALHGTASDLMLALYRRIPLDRLRTEGDRTVLERLLSWSDEG